MFLPVIAVALVAATDSWGARSASITVSENGRHAVVVEPMGRSGAQFSWFGHRSPDEGAGVASLELSTQDLLTTERFENPRLLKRVSTSHFPTEVLVSDEGHGFVALGRHGGNRSGKTLMTFDSTGQPLGSWSVADIEETGGLKGYPGSVSSVSWRRGSWIDEETSEVVITSTLGQVFVARLDRRELRLGGCSELSRALMYGGDRRQQFVLDALTLLDCPEHAEEYAKLTGPTYPIATRLRAARALFRTGDSSAGPLVMDVALKEGPEEGVTRQDIAFALRDLHHYAKGDVVLVLRDRLLRLDRVLLEPRTEALGRYGPLTAPLLVEMLRDTQAPPHYRRAAANALAEAGDASCVNALLEATNAIDKALALSALQSAAAIEGGSVAGRLVPLIDTRDHFNGFLLHYFSTFRHPTAKAKLEEYLATTSAPWLQERIKKAILFQSSEE